MENIRDYSTLMSSKYNDNAYHKTPQHEKIYEETTK